MKNTKLLLAIATSAALLTGCQNTHGIDTNMAISSGLNAYKAATLSDADAKAIANQGCAEMDSGNQVASKSSKYGKRLAKIAKALGNNINGTPVNYKVYMTSDVNAWAMANGCVRVYSGLMDMMNDNEIEGVLGHDARVKAADEELLDPAEVGLGAEQLKAVVVGAEDPEFRCGCDMGLTARELRDPSSKCWIGDADDACHLQCAGCGRGARRTEDLRAQFGRDGLVGEGAHGAVRELGSDRVVHYELLKGDASSLAFLPVREYRRSRI